MPCFDERNDDMDAFLHRFEVYADSQKWQKEQWAVYLSALLKGKALEVYFRLPVKDAQTYEILKDALLKRFNLTEEGFKQKFKTAKPEVGEAPTQFIARLESYLMRWIDLADVKKDFDRLMNLIVREQYLESCPVQLAIFLREKKPKELNKLAALAEQYLDAHVSSKGQTGQGQVGQLGKNIVKKPEVHERTEPSVMRNDKFRRPDGRQCFNCGKQGHISRNCFHLKKVSGMTNVYSGQRSYGRFSPEARRRNDFENRDSMNDMDRQRDSSMTETKPKEKMNESQEAVMTCKAYDRVRCGLCFKWPAHKCNAMTSSEIELKCGCIVPVIADACCSGRENMPVREGMMNGKSVTECNSVKRYRVFNSCSETKLGKE